MAKEIERKFLVHGKPWQEHHVFGSQYIQGYLSTDKERVIRVRLCQDICQNICKDIHGNCNAQSEDSLLQARAYITIKSHISALSANEYEYAIPPEDARILLNTLAIQPLIEKTRYTICHEQHTWQVDVFSGANDGLVVAEIELTSETEAFSAPAWLGAEVSDDPRYKNVSLSTKPFTTW